MPRLRELARLLYRTLARPAAAMAVTLGAVLTIGLLATERYAPAIPVGLATALLVALLATSRKSN